MTTEEANEIKSRVDVLSGDNFNVNFLLLKKTLYSIIDFILGVSSSDSYPMVELVINNVDEEEPIIQSIKKTNTTVDVSAIRDAPGTFILNMPGFFTNNPLMLISCDTGTGGLQIGNGNDGSSVLFGNGSADGSTYSIVIKHIKPFA